MLKDLSFNLIKKILSDVKLGDQRRNQRVIKLANSLLQALAASLPKETL